MFYSLSDFTSQRLYISNCISICEPKRRYKSTSQNGEEEEPSPVKLSKTVAKLVSASRV
jgi:hypothetical protein